MRTRAVLLGVAGVVAAAGVAGLVYAVVPGSTPSAAANDPGAVTVADAYVRMPVAGATSAAAYFSIYNTTDRPDRLTGVVAGAGRSTSLSTSSGGTMRPLPAGVVVPAHGKIVLAAGGAHVMIDKLIGTLAVGQTVNIDAQFARAGELDVIAKVIPYGAPVPTGGPSMPGMGS